MKNYFLWLAKMCTAIVLFGFIAPILFVVAIGIATGSHDEEKATGDNLVAVIELSGVIVSSKDVIKELYQQVENDKVKGIVLRIDSPGGAVGPSQEIYSAVKKLKARKPIVVSMGSVAASGGFYAALGASKIFCQPGTLTGSIGVLLQIPNVTHVIQKIGVDMVTIKSGKLKDVGNSFREMTDEERAYLQGTVSKVQEAFVNAVSEGRNLDRKEVLKFADGRVIVGSEAKELKLVDEFGDIYDASRAVFDLLGTPLKENETPKLFYPKEKFETLKELFNSINQVSRFFSSETQFQYLMH